MKRFPLWAVLLGLLLCLPSGCGREEQDRLPKLPENTTVSLYIREEEGYSQTNLYTKKEVQALNQALAQASVQPVEDWTVPEDPWPIYGFYVWGLSDSDDLDVACFSNLWVDNRGRAYQVEGLDMQALMDSFPADWEQRDGNLLPCRWALALSGGSWNGQFMIPSDPVPALDGLSMTLDTSSDGLSWTLTNLSASEFSHGNGGWAKLQVCLEDGWYDVPDQFSSVITCEGYILSPGKSYSSTFNLEPYGDLPSGNYRIAFPLDQQEGDAQPVQVYSAVYFLVLEDGTLAQESLV